METMNHPLVIGTRVLVLMPGCQPCGGKAQKVDTSIRAVTLVDGTYVYTILDGRKITQDDVLKVY